MTQQEAVFALASYANEALVFRNMVVELQARVKELEKKLEEKDECG